MDSKNKLLVKTVCYLSTVFPRLQFKITPTNLKYPLDRRRREKAGELGLGSAVG